MTNRLGYDTTILASSVHVSLYFKSAEKLYCVDMSLRAEEYSAMEKEKILNPGSCLSNE